MNNESAYASRSALNSDINVNDLIDRARKFVNENDLVNGEYFINLALASSRCCNGLNVSDMIIQSQAIRSFIKYKNSSIHYVLLVAKKFIRQIKIKNQIDSDTSICFVRALYRAGVLLKNDFIFLSAFLFYKAKNLTENHESLQSNIDLKNTIETNFIAVLDEISKILNFQKENFHREEILLHKIREFFKINSLVSDKNSNLYSDNDVNMVYKFKVFVVSALWIRNLISFLNLSNSKGIEDSRYSEKKFERKNVCLLYFNDGVNKEEYKRLLGNYPGPVNNFNIIQIKDNWYDPDPEEEHTNIFLQNEAKENFDFVLIPVEVYELIKSYFGANIYEIPRFGITPQIVTNLHYESKTKNDSSSQFASPSSYEIHLCRMKILLLTQILADKYKQYIRPRYIQISKFKTVGDLKMKIFRCLINIIKCHDFAISDSDEEEYNRSIKFSNFKFFVPDLSKQKNTIFDIIYGYTNKFISHKIQGEELILRDECLIENLQISTKDVLIIELRTEKFDKRKNWFVNVLSNPIHSSFSKCNLCEKVIRNKTNCTQCEQYFYCSKQCAESDTIHMNFHVKMSQLYKKPFDLSDILSIDLRGIIPSKGGLTGLKNLGNTCFMNSALQCLSACPELTKYFLLKKFTDEVNKNNKDGSGGQVAKAYYDLIKELWTNSGGNGNYLSPWDFRQIFVGFVKKFAGFSQHDSHEMLTYMLDALHEDLNRVKEKPYLELQERMNDELESKAASRWWNSHLSRENSIIVDLFHGQYKSVITCPECQKISITYDPFMYLGLPIAVGQCRAKLKFFPLNEYKIIEVEIPLNENTTLKEMKLRIKKFINKEIYLEGIVTSPCNFSFKKRINDTSLVYSFYKNNYEIILYETEFMINDNKDNLSVFYTVPVEFIEDHSFRTSSKYPSPIFYVKPFILEATNATVKDLYFQIFKYYRKIFSDLENRLYSDYYLNRNDEEYIYDEFEEYFGLKENIPFKLLIVNNLPQSNLQCEFCNKNCEKYCNFNFPLATPLDTIINKQKICRPFILYIEIIGNLLNGKSNHKKMKLFENFNSSKVSISSVFSQGGNPNLYDCLEAFRAEEKLEKDNSWYCSICKTHQEAIKKLEIYSPPNNLIIQLKRFKIKTTNVLLGMMHNKKNETLIDFPIDEFDLRPYVVNELEREDSIYELYAISQHYGGLNSGHYTALCRNQNEWFHFDDEKVLKSRDVVTSAAYLLFYRKKSLSVVR